MVAHAKITEPWKEEKPMPIPRDEKFRSSDGGEIDGFFVTAVYEDDFLLQNLQHSEKGKTVLIASALIASNHVRLVGPGEEGTMSIVAPKTSTDWDTQIDALGYTINSHRMTISVPPEKVEAI